MCVSHRCGTLTISEQTDEFLAPSLNILLALESLSKSNYALRNCAKIYRRTVDDIRLKHLKYIVVTQVLSSLTYTSLINLLSIFSIHQIYDFVF